MKTDQIFIGSLNYIGKNKLSSIFQAVWSWHNRRWKLIPFWMLSIFQIGYFMSDAIEKARNTNIKKKKKNPDNDFCYEPDPTVVNFWPTNLKFKGNTSFSKSGGLYWKFRFQKNATFNILAGGTVWLRYFRHNERKTHWSRAWLKWIIAISNSQNSWRIFEITF